LVFIVPSSDIGLARVMPPAQHLKNSLLSFRSFGFRDRLWWDHGRENYLSAFGQCDRLLGHKLAILDNGAVRRLVHLSLLLFQ